jgi:hypothetical protein
MECNSFQFLFLCYYCTLHHHVMVLFFLVVSPFDWQYFHVSHKEVLTDVEGLLPSGLVLSMWNYFHRDCPQVKTC